MKHHWLGSGCVGLALLAVGCSPPATPPTTPPAPSAERSALLTERPIAALAAAAPASDESDIVARVGTKVITKDQLLAPLLEAHGLNLMLHLAQLELARQAAAEKGIKVTPDDFKHERELTFMRMFKESDDQIRQKAREARDKGDEGTAQKYEAELKVDRESLLDQYFVQQYSQTGRYVTRQEFDLVLQMNCYLRKIAEATPELKGAVTDEVVKKAFSARYGEKIVARHIQANDIQTISEAKRRVQAGENFADVARALSTNVNTAPLGGAITPFTMNATNVPQVFKDAAFALANGQVSDVVHADNAYHIIKVENRIPPRVVKFEDVKDSLRAELEDQVLQAAVNQLRDKVVTQMVANLQVENPVLKKQYADKREEASKVRGQANVDEAMKRERSAPASTTLASPTPTTPTTPASQPAK